MATLTDDITAGCGCGSMRSGDRHPANMTPPPPSPKFNHLPLMGTLHREDRKEEEERRQGISNNFSFSFSLDLS